MIKCPQCGQLLLDDTKYCTKCGGDVYPSNSGTNSSISSGLNNGAGKSSFSYGQPNLSGQSQTPPSQSYFGQSQSSYTAPQPTYIPPQPAYTPPPQYSPPPQYPPQQPYYGPQPPAYGGGGYPRAAKKQPSTPKLVFATILVMCIIAGLIALPCHLFAGLPGVYFCEEMGVSVSFTAGKYKIFVDVEVYIEETLNDPMFKDLTPSQRKETEKELRKLAEEMNDEVQERGTYTVHGNYIIMKSNDAKDDDEIIPSAYVKLDGNKKIMISGKVFKRTGSALKAYFS